VGIELRGSRLDGLQDAGRLAARPNDERCLTLVELLNRQVDVIPDVLEEFRYSRS
jgi:hypothetical protein